MDKEGLIKAITEAESMEEIAKRFTGIPLKDRKEVFLAVLRNKGGNITEACSAIGTGRSTYYKWIKQKKFSDAVGEVRESLIDFGESMLMKQVQAENIAAICFLLKCQGKHRGWVERQELTGEGGRPINITIEPADKHKD